MSEHEDWYEMRYPLRERTATLYSGSKAAYEDQQKRIKELEKEKEALGKTILLRSEQAFKDKERMDELEDILGFYADVKNWHNSGNEKINRISASDIEIMSFDYKGKWLKGADVGGKRARRALKATQK